MAIDCLPSSNAIYMYNLYRKNNTNDTRWFFLSVLKTANVFPLWFGNQRPRALIIVLIWSDWDFNSDSNALGDPHFATCSSPFDAYPPYSQTLKKRRNFIHYNEKRQF